MDTATRSDLAFMDYLRPLLKPHGFEVMGVTSTPGKPQHGSLTVRAGRAVFCWETYEWDMLRPVFEAAISK